MIRLLLPPSQTKADGGTPVPLDLDDLTLPQLTPTRATLIDALVALSTDVEASRAVLGISARQDGEIARNAALRTAPTMPALSRYTGVLYDAIDAASLGRAALRKASRSVLICSALFGVVRGSDPIPAYRLAAEDALPGIGRPGGLWRPILPEALASLEGGQIVDLRSGAYRALAPLSGAIAVRVIRSDGRSVSHDNKAAKGALVRAALTARRTPTSIASLITAAADAGLTLRRSGEPTLDLLMD